MKTALALIFSGSICVFFSFIKPQKPVRDLEGMKKLMKPGYSYVPSGKTVVDGDTVSCQAFFMMKEEVSNLSYKIYLFDLKKNGRMEEYAAALIDSTKWVSNRINLPKFAQHYFNNPAFRNYPVVNISRAQAEKYCEWLSQVWRKNSGNESIVFRLPTRAEFLRAANGSSIDRPYSWKGPYLRDGKGQFQCNFLAIGSAAISRDPETGQLIVQQVPMDYLQLSEGNNSNITAPVRSFHPNEYDLYNLNGNVSEMVAEQDLAVGGDWYSPGYDIRNQSTKKFTEANPMVGFRPVMTFPEIKAEN